MTNQIFRRISHRWGIAVFCLRKILYPKPISFFQIISQCLVQSQMQKTRREAGLMQFDANVRRSFSDLFEDECAVVTAETEVDIDGSTDVFLSGCVGSDIQIAVGVGSFIVDSRSDCFGTDCFNTDD